MAVASAAAEAQTGLQQQQQHIPAVTKTQHRKWPGSGLRPEALLCTALFAQCLPSLGRTVLKLGVLVRQGLELAVLVSS